MRSIGAKFLLLIGVATILFSAFLIYRAYSITNRHVKEVVEEQAAIALSFDLAIRKYVAENVRPLMYELLGKEEFVPEVMSTSYVARTIFEDVRKEFPDYIIKFSSDNPRNPANKAGPEELKMIKYFNDNPNVHRWNGEISIAGEQYMARFSARRMEESCLHCHGDPVHAPASLLKRYGSTAGFHRPVGEVIALDTIAIPMSKITQELWSETTDNLVVIGTGLGLLFLAILLSFKFLITNRLTTIAQHFVSATKQTEYSQIETLEVKGRDEISTLASSFNALANKLRGFYASLETLVQERTVELREANEQLKREIAERKRAEEALQKARNELERRVEERTAELVIANKQLNREVEEREQAQKELRETIERMETAYEQSTIYARELKKKIEERKQAKEELRESEERYRTVLEASPDPVVVYDMDGKVVYLNPAFTSVFGWTQEELLGGRINYVPEENRPETQMMIDTVLAGGSFSGIESRRYTKQRNILDVSISVATYLDRNGNPAGSIHILRDITEQKRLQAQFEQAQKMEAIGTLAGGIAHDFNNLLMGIQGNVSLMAMDVDPAHPYHERLKKIEKQVKSGARLTSYLLGYARKGRYKVRPVDLNRLLEETSENLGRTKKEITIHRELAGDLFTIKGDSGQIEQVLLNLFINAADAMPGGGDLILKTMNTTHKDMKGGLYDPKPGNYVLLTVTDTGTGMDKKTRECIFDPFFTTKEMGRGTGLGLASVYGIIKGHGGYIDVDSKKGKGTTFKIYFPVSEKKDLKVVKTLERPDQGAGTILLVDDEDVILELGRELLVAMGYKVLSARSGKEAVKVYKNNRDDIDIVVLDMIMPNMGGGKTYDRLKEINPDIKVLLSSGFSIDGEATEILARGCNSFIQKPFTMKTLSSKIKEILQKK